MREFQASANAFHASAASEQGAEELVATKPRLSGKVKYTLKKTALAAAFSVDASFNTLQFNARAMAANVVSPEYLATKLGSIRRILGQVGESPPRAPSSLVKPLTLYWWRTRERFFYLGRRNRLRIRASPLIFTTQSTNRWMSRCQGTRCTSI